MDTERVRPQPMGFELPSLGSDAAAVRQRIEAMEKLLERSLTIPGTRIPIGLKAVRVKEAQDADLRLYDAVARYGRVAWFLNQLSCAAGRPVCSAEGDARLAEALAASDGQTRGALLAEAEAEITAANGFIPFARPLRWSLVRGDITGFANNPWGLHPLLPLALTPR